MTSYKFIKDAPKPIDTDEYIKRLMIEFQELLKNKSSDEEEFQKFFERNPCMVPGARSEFDFSPSGHPPVRNTLIAQPRIRGIINRQPDFMWLSSDSVVFCPVLIEIEAPIKKYFNQDGSPTAAFTKAKNQLDEWRTILSKPENQLSFYNDFNVPLDLRRNTFDPYYLLIYGRREEYENNQTLKDKRKTLVDKSSNQYLMSFDRLQPLYVDQSCITSNVKDGEYKTKHLSPTFKIGPHKNQLLDFENLIEAVDRMAYTSDERKVFLKQRIPYCLEKIKEEKSNTKGNRITISLNDLPKQIDE